MRLMTILGTRPEIIRLSMIIPILDENCDHVLVHTGQNYDPKLSSIFFEQLAREPDVFLRVKAATAAKQVGQIISRCDQIMATEKPDAVLILGDTNSGLSAIMAKRRGIRVFHMEAGNRCFDDRVPEEVNRRVIDHSSDILMPYTERSRQNLLDEGVPSRRIFVTGNPIGEVLARFNELIMESKSSKPWGFQKYMLLTLHRAENVDSTPRLSRLVGAIENASQKTKMPVIWPVHPRTKDKLKNLGFKMADSIKLVDPLGFFDFVRLERDAFCVLTDSGTVQEECCLLGVPNVTLRDNTERPETMEVGSNFLSSDDKEKLVVGIRLADSARTTTDPLWSVPEEYRRRCVSTTVAKIVLGHHEGS